MKKITFLIVFFQIYTWSNAQSNAHRMVFLSETNQSAAINTICQFTNSQDILDNGSDPFGSSYSGIRIGRRSRKFNVSGRLFPVGTLVRLAPNSQNEQGYYVVISSKTGRFSDEDENLAGSLFTTISYTCDFDNDGIPNAEDDCPDEAGLPSNNGCPGPPDLSFNLFGSSISSECFSCQQAFNNISTDRHFIGFGGVANISILVENIGSGTSNSTTVGVYESTNSTFESNSDNRVASFSLASLDSNEVAFASGAAFYNDFDFFNNFWLIFRIDDNDSNMESDEGNNTFAIRFRRNIPQEIIPFDNNGW